MDITIAGTIRSDGSLQLDQVLNLPPGPVQVTLRRAPAELPGTALPDTAPRTPDGPWHDKGIVLPVELPRPAPTRRLLPRRAHVRLPDPAWTDEEQP